MLDSVKIVGNVVFIHPDMYFCANTTTITTKESIKQKQLLQDEPANPSKLSAAKLVHLAKTHAIRQPSMAQGISLGTTQAADGQPADGQAADKQKRKQARQGWAYQKGNRPVRSWYIIMPKLHMSEACR